MVRGVTCARDADSDYPDATSTALPEMLGHYTSVKQKAGRLSRPFLLAVGSDQNGIDTRFFNQASYTTGK